MNYHFVVLDFEFRGVAPGIVEVVCVVAHDLTADRVYRVWLEGEYPSSPPFPCGPDTILVAHAVAPAEARCWQTLGWPLPGGWIDTFVEERVRAAGEKPEDGFGLLACCLRHGLPCISSDEKKGMQESILRGGPYGPQQQLDILDYCESDVRETVALFRKLLPNMNVPQAIVRGDSMAVFAASGDRGLPVDVERFTTMKQLGNVGLRRLWQEHLDVHGLMQAGSFCYRRFEELVMKSGTPWPRTDTGRFKYDKDTLKDASKVYGEPWASVYELVRSIAEGAVDGLKIGSDGRLYAAPKPFMTFTGRAAPSTSEFLFLGPKWLRSLLQPSRGHTLLQFDWSNQEYAIAAALSQDQAMMAAYDDGDPYMTFAKMAGAVPPRATKDSHSVERSAYKIVSLAVLMGMGVVNIGRQTGTGYFGGQELLRKHKRAFPNFWDWSDAVAATGAAGRDIETSFGLVYNPGDPNQFKPRTARNFLLQSTGSDMLRVALLLLEQAGIRVISTIHDAVLVECETNRVEAVVRDVVSIMEDASQIVLWGRLTVRVDPPKVDLGHGELTRVDYPFHFQDKKGIKTWRKLAPLLNLHLDAYNG
jgi:DNA polymerase-1